MQIAPQRRPDRGTGTRVGGVLGPETGEVLRHVARERLLDHARRTAADARQILEASPVGERPELVGGHLADGVGSPTERLHLVGRAPAPLEQRRDFVQRLDRIHGADGTLRRMTEHVKSVSVQRVIDVQASASIARPAAEFQLATVRARQRQEVLRQPLPACDLGAHVVE